ncbi:protein of unknown function [Methanoculleus bourgensis]|uniref:DUF4411 family protein n=1 Tax=Methanoculleus bourgensis TaxID=83986 RepID=A0A0X3BI10_9EURY|nr:protein of unknown function [Methanoculleus bourgensis]
MPGDATLYVVDTSSLIEMKWYYPISIFESLWMNSLRGQGGTTNISSRSARISRWKWCTRSFQSSRN